MTKHVAKLDHRHFAVLSAGLLRERARIEERIPRREITLPCDLREHGSRESLAAWQYSSRCRASTLQRARSLRLIGQGSGEGLHRALLSLPMKVWIVGPPVRQDALFREWFDRCRNGDFRIVLRANSVQVSGIPIAPNWGIPTASSPLRSISRLSQAQCLTAEEFLEALVKALPLGDGFANALFRQTGHRFEYAHGDVADVEAPLRWCPDPKKTPAAIQEV